MTVIKYVTCNEINGGVEISGISGMVIDRVYVSWVNRHRYGI
jgi:hypothetical protein